MRIALPILVFWILAGNVSASKIHLKNPWPGTPMWTTLRVLGPVIAGPPGAAMTDDGDDWYSFTLADHLPPNGSFHIVKYSATAWDADQPDYASQLDFRPGGISKTGPEFNIGDIRGVGDDVWIIPMGGTLPPVITDIPQAKKVAYLFSPWPESAPMAKVAGNAAFATMKMAPDPKRCGWYGAYLNAAPFAVSFKSLLGSETYGKNGLGDSQAVDLSAYFSTADTVFLTPDPFPVGPLKVTTSIPSGMVGTCAFSLAMTVRDFSIQHPDFAKADMNGIEALTGLVQNTLDAENKPLRSAKPYNRMSDFSHWFRNDSTAAAPLGNHTTCRDLPIKKIERGLWSYNSLKDSPSHSFFPIDDFNRFNETAASQYLDPSSGMPRNDPTGAQHNFSFCLEMHASFTYRPGQHFHFQGDDDMWAFIDRKLALDLGGPHTPVAGTVKLDTLKLKAGTEYPFDLFYCERRGNGSEFIMETPIFFEQQAAIYAKVALLTGGAVQYEIFERPSDAQSCASTGSGEGAPATSDFKLSGPGANPALALNEGTAFGGITVNPGRTRVSVDTSKITGLVPGMYSITYVSAATGKGGSIQFSVPGTVGIKPRRSVRLVPNPAGESGFRVDVNARRLPTDRPGNGVHFTLPN